jgi:sorting nexin-8
VLTLSQELSVWRKQATISVQDEFTGRALPPDLEDSLPSTLTDIFDTVRSGVKRSAEIYINLCTLLERLAKRNEGFAADHLRFSLALQSLTEVTRDTYAIDTNDVPLLNEGIKATASHLSASQSLLEDEARGWEEGVLEDLKRQRDCLVSVREMFDRRDRYARNNIPQLERRIDTNEKKLQDLRTRPQGTVKPGEIEKVEEAIFKVCNPTFGFCYCLPFKHHSHMAFVETAGQGIHRTATRTRGVHQGVHPRRNRLLPAKPVSY